MSYQDKTKNYQNLLTGVSRGVTGLHSDNDHYLHIGQIRNEAMLGDMLEFQRGSYTHYALYLGEGKVMNVDVEDNRANEARIRLRTLDEVCDDGKARVRNHEDIAQSLFNLTVRQPQDILQTAKSFEERVVPYEFDFRNCEYYCTLWRYGKGFSTQAEMQASGPEGSNSKCWTANHTSADFFVKDGYAKYKQLAEDRQEAFENNKW